MANPEHVEIVKQGWAAFDIWREKNPDVQLDLAGANLHRVDLSGVDLGRADLRWAELNVADLYRTNLSEACIENATMGFTVLADLDLSTVKGLGTVRHFGPSSIGVDTLYRSQGKIPEEFLRGCGVPEDFITYLPSLIGTMQPIQYQSCFISDSSQGEEFARRLHEKMRGEKLRGWFAPEDMQGARNSSSKSTGPSRSTTACCWCSRSTA